jgi:murein DD-endopeptidase MepM/ murein hydrolase activator NlpD
VGGGPHQEEEPVPHSIRNLVRAGLCAAALTVVVSGCSGPPEQAKPVWAGAEQSASATTTPPAAPAATPAAAPTPTAPKSSAPPESKYVFPVKGGKSSYAKEHHDYPASDVMTNCGNTFVAVTGGTVVFTSTVDRWTAKANAGATRGGLSVAIVGDDGVRYYGSHLSKVDAAVKPGVRVTAGQTLGTTGKTGDASACHVHFGISPPCERGSDWYTQRGSIWPWPYLDSWRDKGQKSPVAEIKAWKDKNGCPTKAKVDP